MRLKDLLPMVVEAYKNKTDRFPTKTFLLKLCYLIDVDHKSRTGNQLLEEEWVYYHYGPYIFEYDDALKSSLLEMENGRSAAGYDYEVIKTAADQSPLRGNFDIMQSINHVVSDFADSDLDDLLDYVYFDTEPMLAVQWRGQKIDMSKVLPAEEYRVRKRKISKKSLEKLRKKYREKGKELRA